MHFKMKIEILPYFLETIIGESTFSHGSVVYRCEGCNEILIVHVNPGYAVFTNSDISTILKKTCGKCNTHNIYTSKDLDTAQDQHAFFVNEKSLYVCEEAQELFKQAVQKEIEFLQNARNNIVNSQIITKTLAIIDKIKRE